MLRKIVFFLIGIGYLHLYGQQWHDPSKNIFENEQQFYAYWKDKTITKGCGYKPYARWLYFWKPRYYKGQQPNPQILWEEAQKMNAFSQKTNAWQGNWSNIGPIGEPTGTGGIGRVTCIAFHPTQSNTMFIGTPAGGLWKSTNSGLTWTPMTDQLPVMGVSGILIHPTNPNIMYIATGDRSAADTYSIGVLKSTDGGNSWQTTGLSFNMTSTAVIRKLVMHPTNPDILFCATSQGIFKSTDAANSWLLKQSGNIYDIEFKPNAPDTMYASGGGFIIRSTNGGEAWSSFQSGLNLTNAGRIELTVTAHDPNYIYGVVANSQTQGLHSIIKSTDSNTWTAIQDNTPNYLGWKYDGSDTGGQGWYDLDIIASPTNKNDIYVGGVNIWRSTDGGSTFSLAGHWQGFGAPYVHADIHYFAYQGNYLWVGCDGGIYRRSPTLPAWQSYNSNLSIHQIYRIGISEADPDLVTAGAQDNGSTKYNGATFSYLNGADGMETTVDPQNPAVIYVSIYYGEVLRSTNGGSSFTKITGNGVNGITETGDWVTPYLINPQNPYSLFIGLKNVWRSGNRGNSWTKISDINQELVALDVAPTDSNTIYAASLGTIYKTTDGGATWTTLNFSPPGAITYLKIHPNNPNQLYVTLSNFTPNEKLYLSTDGGSTWQNISDGLPNVPANCIEYQKNSNDGIYVGTDLGVFYKNNQIPRFQPYTYGMPLIPVNELHIHYGTQTLYAATYGRGVWKSELYSDPTTPPTVNFTANPTRTCINVPIQFEDSSTHIPLTYAWNFPNANPSTSSIATPQVRYLTPGLHDVSLTVTNVAGSSSLTKNQYINILPAHPLPYQEGFEQNFLPDTLWKIASDDTTTWKRVTAINKQGTPSQVVMMPCYNYSYTNAADELVTAPINLTNYTSAKLFFDLSYARYNSSRYERLRVLLSTDCGETFSQVYSRQNTGLQTTTETTNYYEPTDASHWRTDSINLQNYLASGTVIVKFLVTNGNGNNLYLDNINIQGTCDPSLSLTLMQSNDTLWATPYALSYQWYGPDSQLIATTSEPFLPVSQNGIYTVIASFNGCLVSSQIQVVSVLPFINGLNFHIFPNPVHETLHIHTNQPLQQACKITLADLSGKTVLQHTLQPFHADFTLDLQTLPAALYLLKIDYNHQTLYHKLVKE